MLVLVSTPACRKDEASVINALFDEGLEILHLRKPLSGRPEWMALAEQVDPRFRERISLHDHHDLAPALGMRRLHFTEEKRKNSTITEWQDLRSQGYHLSTSVHDTASASQLPDLFDYAFLGPVFNSISKPGYAATLQELSALPPARTMLVAIGGIQESNMAVARSMGFKAIAVLGAIWQEGDPVHNFQQIKKAWKAFAP